MNLVPRNGEPAGTTSCKLFLIQMIGTPLLFVFALLNGDDGNTPAPAIGLVYVYMMVLCLAPAGLICGLSGLSRPSDHRATMGVVCNLAMIVVPVLLIVGL